MLQPQYQNESIQEIENIKRNSDKSIDRYGKNKHLKKVFFQNNDKKKLKCIFLQTYSFKERRNEANKIKNIKCRNHDPPIITTTAATPQDSPNTTLEAGVTFRHWDSNDMDRLEKVFFIRKLR